MPLTGSCAHRTHAQTHTEESKRPTVPLPHGLAYPLSFANICQNFIQNFYLQLSKWGQTIPNKATISLNTSCHNDLLWLGDMNPDRIYSLPQYQDPLGTQYDGEFFA